MANNPTGVDFAGDSANDGVANNDESIQIAYGRHGHQRSRSSSRGSRSRDRSRSKSNSAKTPSSSSQRGQKLKHLLGESLADDNVKELRVKDKHTLFENMLQQAFLTSVKATERKKELHVLLSSSVKIDKVLAIDTLQNCERLGELAYLWPHAFLKLVQVRLNALDKPRISSKDSPLVAMHKKYIESQAKLKVVLDAFACMDHMVDDSRHFTESAMIDACSRLMKAAGLTLPLKETYDGEPRAILYLMKKVRPEVEERLEKRNPPKKSNSYSNSGRNNNYSNFGGSNRQGSRGGFRSQGSNFNNGFGGQSQKPCYQFNKPIGCNRGSRCKFAHRCQQCGAFGRPVFQCCGGGGFNSFAPRSPQRQGPPMAKPSMPNLSHQR